MLSVHRFLNPGKFWHYIPNLIYVVIFVLGLVVTCVLRWSNRYPIYQNKVFQYWMRKSMRDENHYCTHSVLSLWHYIPNLICLVKLLIFVIDLVITCVLRWFNRLWTHQNNVCLVLIEKINDDQNHFNLFWPHRVLIHGKI